MTDHAKTITILRAVADLLEASPELPAPYLSFHFSLTGQDHDGIPAMTVKLAAALPGPWATRINEADDGRTTMYLESRATGFCSIGAPVEAMGTLAGKRVVTEWEPLPVIAAILAGNEGGSDV